VGVLAGGVNVRALGESQFLLVGLVAVAMLGMAWVGELWAPLAVAGGGVLGVLVGVVAARAAELTAPLDDVPPPLFALVGVGLAWGGAAYAPALSLSSFAGVATGYWLAAAALAVVDG